VAERAFKVEARIAQELSKLRSPNIIRTHGVVLGKERFLVVERAQGSLEDIFRAAKWSTAAFSVKYLTKIVLDVATGLHDMHNFGLIHRDLAIRNILIMSDDTAKLNDFGLSRGVDTKKDEGKTASNIGPVRWMSPESLRQTYSPKSDVWMFGVMLWEMFAREAPYKDKSAVEVAVMTFSTGCTLVLDPKWPEGGRSIMADCWNKEPTKRPTMNEIQVRLLQCSQAVNAAPLLNPGYAPIMSPTYANI